MCAWILYVLCVQRAVQIISETVWCLNIATSYIKLLHKINLIQHS